jgi:hypothetical protein
VKLDRLAFQHLVVDRSVNAGDVVVGEGLEAPRALHHAQRPGVGMQLDRRARGVLADHQRRVPGGDTEQEIVPRLRRSTNPSRPDRERGGVGSELVGTGRKRHAASISTRFEGTRAKE